VAEKWALIPPQVRLDLPLRRRGAAPQIVGGETVRQTLINILNNAATPPARGGDRGTWNVAELTIEGAIAVQHYRYIAAKAGRAFFSTKAAGRGIGLFLANATIERLGGSVALFNRDGGGGCTRVTIPLTRLGRRRMNTRPARQPPAGVDDDAVFAAVLARALARRGFEVESAAGLARQSRRRGAAVPSLRWWT